MKQLAFSVYDEKAECFAHPFFTSTVGIAARMMAEWANNENSMVAKHPEDFTLYHVGFWTDNDAKLHQLDTPKFIAKATEYIKPNGGNPNAP